MSEPRTPFVSKKLQRSVAKSFSDEVRKLVRLNQEAYLDSNNIMTFQHGRRWESPVNDTGDKSGEMERHSATCTISAEDIVRGDPNLIFERADEIAHEFGSMIFRTLLKKVDEATAKTGNVINMAEHDSVLDAFAASIESVEMSLDDEGNLRLPTIFLNPIQQARLVKEIENAPLALKSRIERIKELKLEEATNREAERKGRFERPKL